MPSTPTSSSAPASTSTTASSRSSGATSPTSWGPSPSPIRSRSSTRSPRREAARSCAACSRHAPSGSIPATSPRSRNDRRASLRRAFLRRAEPVYRDLPEAWIERAGSVDDAVLLETRRFDPENYRSYLFLHPLAVIRASSPAEVPPLLRELEEHSRRGHFAAGYLAYEAGGEEPLGRSAPGYPLA